jgi:GNAT superfamily N-acetyltransferase
LTLLNATVAGKDKQMTLVVLKPVIDCLPAGLDDVRAEAIAEGYRFVERLSNDWEANAARFRRDGEALLAGYVSRRLAAIGGITLDPVAADALRMRRFYVRRAFRGQGIGRRLVDALLENSRRTGRIVVVNAARGSSPFWEAVGFVPDARDGHTHILLPSRPGAS